MEPNLVNWHSVVSAIIFSGIGIVIYVGGFILLELLTPKRDVWREIAEEKNIALALLIGSFAIGIAIIISSAIRG